VRVFEEENRVLTSSIDAHLKIYSLDEMELVHQMKFKAPISGFDMTSDFSHLAIGHLDGSFTISKNSSKEKKIERLNQDAMMLNLSSNKEALNYKYFFRGIYNKVVNENAKRVEVIKAEKLKRYDNFLKKFKYAEALTQALTTFDTQIIVSIIEELLLRDGLDIGLKGLADEAMVNLLNFIHKKCDSSNH